jgi:hypothetical protein
LLDSLRRRKRAVARIVTPMLAIVWLGVSASACLGMTTASLHETLADVPVTGRHDPAAHDQHSRHSDTGDHHGGCPHCPFTVGSQQDEAASSHIPCSALDDISDGPATPAKLELKQLLPVAFVVPPQVVFRGFARHATLHPPWAAPSAVSLYLLHCAILI